jgi:metabolite-proton symporter
MGSAATATHAPHTTPSWKVAAASFVGTAVEWYDFFLYGTAAGLIFHELFFPQLDPRVGTLAAFATFAAGFVARPLGGVIFGHYGDTLGRKAMLSLTLVLMGAATFLMGLLPTYASIGLWAPVLLVLLRLLQGIGLGGEWGGAVLMAVEHAPAHRRGFYGSWPQMGAPAGMLLANLAYAAVQSRLTPEEFLAWGWRVPFLLSALLIVVGVLIRLGLAESPAMQAAAQAAAQAAKAAAAAAPGGETPPRLPVVEALRRYPKQILLAAGSRFVETGVFYVLTTFVLAYGKNELKLTGGEVQRGVLLASLVHLFAIPLFGALSDRFGRRPVYLAGALFSAAWAFPFFQLLDSRAPGLIALAIALGLVGHAAMYGPQSALFSELFSARVRYSGASLGYQLASVVAGGLTPVVATALLTFSGGRPWPVALYVVALAVVTVGCVLALAETSKVDLAQVGAAPPADASAGGGGGAAQRAVQPQSIT